MFFYHAFSFHLARYLKFEFLITLGYLQRELQTFEVEKMQDIANILHERESVCNLSYRKK